MVDVAEILQHWYAGRPTVEVAQSGVDAKIVRWYVAVVAATRMAPGSPPVAEEQWRALARQGSRRSRAPACGRHPHQGRLRRRKRGRAPPGPLTRPARSHEHGACAEKGGSHEASPPCCCGFPKFPAVDHWNSPGDERCGGPGMSLRGCQVPASCPVSSAMVAVMRWPRRGGWPRPGPGGTASGSCRRRCSGRRFGAAAGRAWRRRSSGRR